MELGRLAKNCASKRLATVKGVTASPERILQGGQLSTMFCFVFLVYVLFRVTLATVTNASKMYICSNTKKVYFYSPKIKMSRQLYSK